MTVGDDIGPDEILGRGVFSSNFARGARQNNFSVHIFLEKAGNNHISVDRLTKTTLEEATKVAEAVAAKRGRTFYGWAVIQASSVATDGRQVIASPLPNNPFHADIVLPDSTITDRSEQKHHAQELVVISSWCERYTET